MWELDTLPGAITRATRYSDMLSGGGPLSKDRARLYDSHIVFGMPFQKKNAPNLARASSTMQVQVVTVIVRDDDDDTQRSPSNSRLRPGLTDVSVGVITQRKRVC